MAKKTNKTSHVLNLITSSQPPVASSGETQPSSSASGETQQEGSAAEEPVRVPSANVTVVDPREEGKLAEEIQKNLIQELEKEQTEEQAEQPGKQEEQQEQEDEKEDEITISVDEATPVDLDSYVQIQPVSSKASSELDDNTAEKAIDGQEVTSWQEDVAGYGQGENLTLKFEKTYTVKYLALKLGSWKDDAAYEQNNRPKELDIQTDHLIRKVTFSDEKKEYWVTFSDTCKTSELKLIIEQVYRGLKTSWNDTCIAEVQVYGTEE